MPSANSACSSVLVVALAAAAAGLVWSPTLPPTHFTDEPFAWPAELQYFAVDAAADLTVNCFDAGPDPATSKGVIIFVHGFPDTAASWKDYVLYFGGLGYHARACDMRNVNRSISTVTTLASWDTMADDLLGIAIDTGRSEVVVVGHDTGAVTAQFFAAKYPERTRALVSIGVPHMELYRDYNIANMPFAMRHTWYFLFFGMMGPVARWKIAKDDFAWFIWYLFGASVPGTFSKAKIGRLKEMYRETMTSPLHSTVSTWYEMGTYWILKSLLPPFLHTSEDTMACAWEPVTPITVPTLEIHGKRDHHVKAADMVASAKPGIHMTHPLSAQIFYDDATHWVNLEKRAEIIVDIDAYLHAVDDFTV